MIRSTLLLAALAACVPASEANEEPRGAAGARFVSTPTAQGAPFTTADGWTLTFEHLVLVARVSAQCGLGGGGTSYVAWNGRDAAERWIGALPVSSCAVSAQLEGVFSGGGISRFGGERPFAEVNLPPEVAADVFGQPDNGHVVISSTGGGSIVQGPAITLSVRAERAGETKTLSLKLAPSLLDTSDVDLTRVTPLDVQRDDVVYARYRVEPERMFLGLGGLEALRFEPLAAADRVGNGDGVIEPAELRFLFVDAERDAAICLEDDFRGEGQCGLLLELLARSAQRILVPDE